MLRSQNIGNFIIKRFHSFLLCCINIFYLIEIFKNPFLFGKCDSVLNLENSIQQCFVSCGHITGLCFLSAVWGLDVRVLVARAHGWAFPNMSHTC